MRLARNATNGKIRDDEKVPDEHGKIIVLRGGQHPPFLKNDNPWRGLARHDETVPFLITRDGPPCPDELPPCSPPPARKFRAKALIWDKATQWKALFQTMQENGCNLLRVWATGGTVVYPEAAGQVPFDLYPFVAAKDGGAWKWKVYDAVEHGLWNTDFFDRLTAFVDAANANGVCIQFSLFNYFDLDRDRSSTFQAWGRSPWNPTLSFEPQTRPPDVPKGKTWGEFKLVNVKYSNPNVEDKPATRNIFFIKPENRLRDSQLALLRQLVRALKHKGNVIFEVMNEPGDATDEEMSRFNSEMVGEIDRVIAEINTAEGTRWKPLISVNASLISGGKFDVDWWRTNSATVANFERVDIISYHSLTGFDTFKLVSGCGSTTLAVPRTDPESIRLRVAKHKADQLNRPQDRKALMFSTDAARIDGLDHVFCDSANPLNKVSMRVRDGQIETGVTASAHLGAASESDAAETAADVETTAASSAQRQLALRSDLGDWAFWCFKHSLGPNYGLFHFHNQSSFEMSFQRISKAWRDANG